MNHPIPPLGNFPSAISQITQDPEDAAQNGAMVVGGMAVPQRYISGLGDGEAALREQLRATLPLATDGSLLLVDRVVRGT